MDLILSINFFLFLVFTSTAPMRRLLAHGFSHKPWFHFFCRLLLVKMSRSVASRRHPCRYRRASSTPHQKQFCHTFPRSVASFRLRILLEGLLQFFSSSASSLTCLTSTICVSVLNCQVNFDHQQRMFGEHLLF